MARYASSIWDYENADAGWMAQGACINQPAELFFPERKKGKVGGVSTQRARQICQHCDVRPQCLQYALTLPPDEDWGVWGGTSREDRKNMRNGRRG